MKSPQLHSIMAEGESSSINNIRAIVDNVVNHPQFRSLLNDAVGSTNRTTARTNTTSTATTSLQNHGRSTYSSPVEEFHSIFRFGSSQRQRGGGTVASFNPIASSRGSSVVATPRRSRNRRGAQSPSTASSINPSTNCFAREVVLLNTPTDCSTVRGKAKADLIKNGQVISSFDFNKSWSSDEVMRRIGLAFEEKLKGSTFVAILLH